MDEENMTKSDEHHLSLQKALQQCELVQNMIDISISSLEGLRTKCATSNDLTQKEIRTLEGKLVTYFSRQLSCKRKVSLQERNVELDGFPRLGHWFRIVNMRKEVIEEISPGELTLEALLEMSDEQVCEALQKFGASDEECARLNASLTCLRSAHKSGSKQDWSIQWPTSESGKENTPVGPSDPSQWVRLQLSQSPKLHSRYSQHLCQSPQALAPPFYSPHPHSDRLTVDPHYGLFPSPLDMGHHSLPPSPRQRHFAHTPPRTPLVVNTMTPPGTPQVRRRNKLKAPGTPPPASRKLIHLLPGFTALHRSKSHEFQLGNRIDDAQTPKAKKKNKPLNLKIHSSVAGSCENLPTQRSPLHSDHSLRSFFFPNFVPSTPPVHSETPSANTLSVPRWSPQIPRRDLGNSIKHRFSTKYWMSQTCIVLLKCLLKCHNKCTKEAPPCHLLIYHRGARQLVRTESVPCDINNPLRYSDLHISQTLPKTNKINKDHIPVPYQPDSSSNPSSTTSSTPSSPAPPLPPSATPPSPLHPSPQSARQQKPSNLTGNDEAEGSADEFEEMNLSLLSARNFPRKASQTSIFLQEWDIPMEQLEIGELIGKGRFGQVYHGRWHGEVAIRLIDIERDNEEQLKAFKREVMAYRNTRHENVVLFMGACMRPPHLAIITSLCKGRTLYSVIRDAKVVLDVNKTRQIAQEMVKGMGYLHAKGILHKDMKSKNVFYDNGKVVITDFGLFTISGVLQAGRRKDKLRIPSGWLCHLAPELIRQLSPETAENQLPFSKQSDVFAFGTIWYELHAREWPFKNQPAEVIIWQVGSGMKPNLTQIGMGKEISDILLFCWAYEQEERPSFSKLVELLEKLPKRNRRLSHPVHFWKSAEYVK
uniref:non-specific serine/threonine protein kinase n=1 Tax=Cyprinus carpio TaxID=7962 RepID=A0A8C2I097_CYPCA